MTQGLNVDAITGSDFGPPDRWRVDARRARSALTATTARLVEILRSARHPGARAVGEWTVADVAAHLGHVISAETTLLQTAGDRSAPGIPADNIVETAARFNALMLEDDPERDPVVLADRIETGTTGFLDVLASLRGDEPVVWLGRVVLPSAAVACHLLEETIVHGYDIARAERRQWPIERDHAALALDLVPDLLRFGGAVSQRSFVHHDRAAGFSACFDIRPRGGRRQFFVFRDGRLDIEDPSGQRVDCHIWGDPAALLLLTMGRIGIARAALTGKVIAWGRRPALALKLPSLLRNP